MATDVSSFVDPLAQFFAHSLRSPILRRPDEEGLEYEDVWFPSLDGVILEGWFIPAKASDKLIIANHPMPCNRYGYPGHLPGCTQFGGGVGSGGICGIGQLECRDVVGSILYARSRADLAGMNIGLLSRCLGADSTIVALSRFPKYFTDIKALIALQPVSGRAFVETGAKAAGLDHQAAAKQFDTAVHNLTGFHLDELSPIPDAHDVTIPTLVAQVHEDVMTHPSDVQTIYDKIGTEEKDLFWIEGTTRRFDGYNYFGEHPERMTAWFDKYMR